MEVKEITVIIEGGNAPVVITAFPDYYLRIEEGLWDLRVWTFTVNKYFGFTFITGKFLRASFKRSKVVLWAVT